MNTIRFFMIAILLCSQPVFAQEKEDFAGTWFGEQLHISPNGSRFYHYEKIHVENDGAMHVRFYECKKDKLNLLVEYKGTILSDAYTIYVIYTEKDGIPLPAPWPHNYDILTWEKDMIQYSSQVNGELFENRRVDKNFKIPCGELIG